LDGPPTCLRAMTILGWEASDLIVHEPHESAKAAQCPVERGDRQGLLTNGGPPFLMPAC